MPTNSTPVPVGNAHPTPFNGASGTDSQISPSVNSSSGATSTTAYNADGEVTQTTDADGRTTTYSYDSRGDQTGETWLNSSGGAIYVATYTYDVAQEMTGASDPNSLITIAYDSDGWVDTIATSGPGSGQPTVTLTYGYDPSGAVTSITDSLSGTGGAGQGITSYAYDPALRLTTITQSFGGTAGPQIVYGYDPGGRITEEDRTIGGSGTDVYTTFAYDAQNHVTAINSTSKSLALNASFYRDINQTLDPAGRVTTVTFNNNGSSTSTTYSYDPSGQVTGSTGSSNNSYSYDLNGNPNSTGYTAGAGNELTNSPDATYTYDNDGNIISATTSSGTTTYTYDYANRITSVDQNGTLYWVARNTTDGSIVLPPEPPPAAPVSPVVDRPIEEGAVGGALGTALGYTFVAIVFFGNAEVTLPVLLFMYGWCAVGAYQGASNTTPGMSPGHAYASGIEQGVLVGGTAAIPGPKPRVGPR